MMLIEVGLEHATDGNGDTKDHLKVHSDIHEYYVYVLKSVCFYLDEYLLWNLQIK
jgi:hypothetical protein